MPVVKTPEDPAIARGLEAALLAVGGVRALGKLLGISHQSVMQWKKIPAERLIEIERVTNVPREILRPDLYRRPRDMSKKSFA